MNYSHPLIEEKACLHFTQKGNGKNYKNEDRFRGKVDQHCCDKLYGLYLLLTENEIMARLRIRE